MAERDSEANSLAGEDQRTLAAWSHGWMLAAYRQAKRAFDANPNEPSGLDRAETELLLYVHALHNCRRSAAAVLGQGNATLADFDAAVEGLPKLRDQLEHHDEYIQGSGRHQRKAGVKAGEQWWFPELSGGSRSIDDGPQLRWMRFGISSKRLSSSTPHVFEDVASVTIEIVPSLRAATDLSEAALAAVGIDTTSSITEVRTWCQELAQE